jgi:hypothetical protein
MDFATLLRILPLAMQLIQSASDPSTTAGQLAQALRELLSRHKAQLDQVAAMHPQMVGAHSLARPPQEPSLEYIKTPEDLLQFIKSQPTTGDAAPGTTRR